MARTLSVKNLYSQRFSTLSIEGKYKEAFDHPSDSGIWLIYGKEKNGKTTFALQLANYLSTLKRTLYISGEEGTEKEFTASCMRAGIKETNSDIHFIPYEPIEELRERLLSRKSEPVIFIDNMTIYNDELKNGGLRKLQKEFPKKLFIFIAHEEAGEPYTATAKLCKRLAKIICHVEGMTCDVSGRCPGGRLIVNEQQASLYYGETLKTEEYGTEYEATNQ